ncbi:hypothetical protein LUZ63_010776 [Rhynchospora breviuscula]|uniref:Uncharacterized protein n=1 Tax=Rhynchospora breviuscula TaxID=2022672 RepID=A0A9Q0HQC8_9POAL|nr:hypothetical protein LUZ63_010776 [Rhynchospora breviuscula]
MAETKRRLPPWMLKQKTETKVQSSDANLKPEEKCEDLIKEKHVKRQQRKRTLEEKNDQYEEEPVKRKQRRKTLNQDPDEFEEVEGALHKCQTRRRNSRGRRKHEMEIGEEKEGSKDGVKNKRAQKRRSVISDDETDLTVDDLVSIAEEYVNADKHKQEQRASATTTENGPAKNASKPLLGPSITKGLLKCSTNTPSPDFSDYAIGENPTNVPKSGDPAQEMLDLFLGPLLRKPPPVKEPAVESVDEVCSISLVKTCDHAVYREGNAVEETETLAKKKSSLKDKVSMFLS